MKKNDKQVLVVNDVFDPNINKEAQNSQTLKTLKQEIEEIAQQGYGGGNWRRLFNQVLSLINKRLKK